MNKAGLLLALTAFTSAAAAQELHLAAPALPEAAWKGELRSLGDDWSRRSAGRVRLVVEAPEGTDDVRTVRQLRTGSLQGALLTPAGLAQIDRAPLALGVPMAFEDLDEARAVRARLQPRLDAAFAAKGFVVLAWIDAGSQRFFCVEACARPADLKPLRMFQWSGDPRSLRIWRAAGFDAQPAAFHQLAGGFRTGRFEAAGLLPYAARNQQVHRKARYMTDLDWSLLLGAIVVTRESWDRIPAATRAELAASAGDAGVRLAAVAAGLERDAIETMRRQGLHVVAVNEKGRSAWRRLAEASYAGIRGNLVPRDAFDAVFHERAALRADAPAKAAS